MARFVSVVGSGLVAAAAFAFFFWWINNTHQVNGVGLLRRQDWPINSPWVWAVGGFAVGTAGSLVGALRRADHARKTQELAEERGREYAESYSLPPEVTFLPLFEGWSNGRNAMIGSENKLPVTLFDYTTITDGGESKTVAQGTAVLLRVKGLPAFDLRPRTLGRKILGWAGFEGMTFDPSAAHPADADTIQRFSERFYLAPTDPLAMIGDMAKDQPPEPDDREEAVRRLFTPSVMEAVNEYSEYAIQSRPGYVAVWRGDHVLAAGMRTELWDTAVELVALLTRPSGSGSGPVIPGKAGKDARRQLRKVRNTLIGAAVGSFVGFILSAMAVPLVFFRRVPEQGLGLGFFVEPLLFFGLILGGAALGAGIASRLRVRDMPPETAEDPARRRARQKVAMYGALVGFFAGFFGGLALFVASKILFNWKLDDFGVDSALFFASIFGGGLLGAVTCGMVAERLYRWRQTDPTES